MKITILILNWNNAKDTLNCLASIYGNIPKSLITETVVIDNGSSDKSVRLIREKYPHLKILENSSNMGYAAGNNRGINYALCNKSEFILILNNDILIAPGMVSSLLETQRVTNAAIISPKIYFSPGFEFHQDRYNKKEIGRVIWYAGGIIDWNNITGSHIGVDTVDNGQYNADRQVDYATGAAMLVKGELFEKIGLLDEKYFLYYEDMDLCQRAKLNHYQCYLSSKAIAWHNNAASSSSGSSLQDYYISRNRLLFGSRYASLRVKIFLYKEALFLLARGRQWQKKGVADFFTGNLGKGRYE